MPRTPLQPRKTPRQQRSQATVQAIVDAATRVLARESLQGFNTNRVAEVAGVSIGSLYQYFPNKAALIAALIAGAQATLAQRVDETITRCEGLDLRGSISALVAVAIEQQFGQPLLPAALDHEEARLPLQRELAQAQSRLAGSLTRLLERHRRSIAVAPTPATARDCLVIAKALVEADAADRRTPPPGLAARLERALLAYLCWKA